MTQLQKIVAKAKTLRKSYPNAKWTDLIKKASKLVTPAKKSVSGIKRTIVKKSAPAIPLIKKRIVSKSDFAMAGVKKKKATKKAIKKSPARSMHKDTKSHNVNIRVMSGVDLQPYYQNLDTLYSRLDNTQEYYKYLQKLKPSEKYTKTHITRDLKLTREKIQFLKDQIKSFREMIIRATKKI
jgi:hypothetical protein